MIQVQLKLRPTKAQARTFERWLWHLTSVWNWSIRTLENSPKLLSSYDMKARLKGHSVRMEIPQNALEGTVATAHNGYQRYRRGLARKPRLKGQRRKLSSIAFSHWDGTGCHRIRNGRASVPGIGLVRFHRQDIPAGRIGRTRILGALRKDAEDGKRKTYTRVDSLW